MFNSNRWLNQDGQLLQRGKGNHCLWSVGWKNEEIMLIGKITHFLHYVEEQFVIYNRDRLKTLKSSDFHPQSSVLGTTGSLGRHVRRAARCAIISTLTFFTNPLPYLCTVHCFNLLSHSKEDCFSIFRYILPTIL